jgi:predicted metal-dependent phosphoesterase TrpH
MAVCLSNKPIAQNTRMLKQVWETVKADSCPLEYNFHLHTVCSDGKLTPSTLVEQAITLGVKGLAITDHHTVRGFYLTQALLESIRQENPNSPIPHLWTGVEINAYLLGVDVHILGYGFDPEHPSLEVYLRGERPTGKDYNADRVINGIRQAGGLAVLAHPARYRLPAADLIPAAAYLGIDGVEAYYAYNNPNPWQPSPRETEEMKRLAQQYNLFTTCGTDTHGPNITRRL